MTKFDTDNLNAPHTLRELGVEPAPAVDVSTEAVMRRLDGVTPGPWNFDHRENDVMVQVFVAKNGLIKPIHESDLGYRDDTDAEIIANSRFIAASRDLVPALLADRDRLANEVERLTAGLSLWIDRAEAAEAAEAEVARLRDVYWRLRSYATHDDGCKLNKAPRFSGPCSCGLADALKGGAA